MLDFGIKKVMNKGVFGNADLSIGNHGRYAERLMGAGFQEKVRIMGFGNANNVNDAGFPGGGGRWRAPMQGLNSKKMVAFNMNYEDKGKLKLDAGGRWNHSNGDLQQTQAVENFGNGHQTP